jgi:hypothetical protein
VPSAFDRLRVLENRYNGPIPRVAIAAALHQENLELRTAWEQSRFYRRWTRQAIDASARWRAAESQGGFNDWPYPRKLACRVDLASTIALSLSQYLAWCIHIHGAETRYAKRR